MQGKWQLPGNWRAQFRILIYILIREMFEQVHVHDGQGRFCTINSTKTLNYNIDKCQQYFFFSNNIWLPNDDVQLQMKQIEVYLWE